MRPEQYLDQIITLKTFDGRSFYGWFCGIEDLTDTEDGRDHYEIWTEDGISMISEPEVAKIIPSGKRKDLFTGEITEVDLAKMDAYIATKCNKDEAGSSSCP